MTNQKKEPIKKMTGPLTTILITKNLKKKNLYLNFQTKLFIKYI